MLYTFQHAKFKFLPKKLLVSKNLRTFAEPVPAKPLNDAQMCGSFYFLYISLAEILVFSNDYYLFVNIENMEENGNMLIIRELWICWLIALKQEFYSCTTIGYSLNQKQKIENSRCPKLPILVARFQVYQYAKFGYKY